VKKILITGIARGLGKKLCDYFLEKGFFVYGTTRNVISVQPSKNLKLFYLDLTDNSSIDKVVDYFIESEEIPDAVIHNSGVAYLDPADVLEDKECRHIFNVNFFGPLYLTKRLLPILRKQDKTNLIFISSIVSIDHWPHLGIYAASKAAIEAVAFEWAVLLRKWNIYVSVIQPNPLPTDMQILRSKNAKNSPYLDLGERLLKWEKIADVCKLIQKILTDESPEYQYQTGSYSKKTVQSFLKKNVYQRALEKYQKLFLQ
jgi:NAD(P)-dependent dehydrogenase (short-subunit alcohol dehydrogenase family)